MARPVGGLGHSLITKVDMSDLLIYCDSARHHLRRVAVDRFTLLPDGNWHEEPTSRAGKTVGAGYTLHGNSVDQPGWANDPNTAGKHRVKFDLTCRKCKQQTLTVNETTLFPALTAVRRAGESEVSLVALAAIIKKQAEH